MVANYSGSDRPTVMGGRILVAGVLTTQDTRRMTDDKGAIIGYSKIPSHVMLSNVLDVYLASNNLVVRNM